MRKNMSGNNIDSTPRTQQEFDNVEKALTALQGGWTNTPDYEMFSDPKTQDVMLKKNDQMHHVISSETNVDPGQIEAAYNKQANSIVTFFTQFHTPGNEVLDHKPDRGFGVPFRGGRNNPKFQSDIEPLYPLANPKFAVNPNMLTRMLVGTPPALIETYTQSNEPGESGAVFFMPILADMIPDICPDGDPAKFERLKKISDFIVAETAKFAHERVGVEYFGLGGTLPLVSGFGAKMKDFDLDNPDRMKNFVTTTGHAETVFLLVETMKQVLATETGEHISEDRKIGVIGGAGSIGFSTIDTIASTMPEYDIYATDMVEKLPKLHTKFNSHENSDKLHIAASTLDVLQNTNIILSAITGLVDLDEIEKEAGVKIDLTGKVIIDDSQPACFDQAQVVARGGKVVAVVGEDMSDTGFLKRDGLYTSDGSPYAYGENDGLWTPKPTDEFWVPTYPAWGCEAEVAIIARAITRKKKTREIALTAPVKPANVREIGALSMEYGICVAPFQFNGQPVHIS
jgi:hypothetical protein